MSTLFALYVAICVWLFTNSIITRLVLYVLVYLFPNISVVAVGAIGLLTYVPALIPAVITFKRLRR
jgi:hypothetical protein